MKLEQEDAGFLGNERNRHGAVASAREVNTDQPSWISEHEPQFSTPTLHRDPHVLTGTDSDVIQVRFPLKQLSLQGLFNSRSPIPPAGCATGNDPASTAFRGYSREPIWATNDGCGRSTMQTTKSATRRQGQHERLPP